MQGEKQSLSARETIHISFLLRTIEPYSGTEGSLRRGYSPKAWQVVRSPPSEHGETSFSLSFGKSGNSPADVEYLNSWRPESVKITMRQVCERRLTALLLLSTRGTAALWRRSEAPSGLPTEPLAHAHLQCKSDSDILKATTGRVTNRDAGLEPSITVNSSRNHDLLYFFSVCFTFQSIARLIKVLSAGCAQKTDLAGRNGADRWRSVNGRASVPSRRSLFCIEERTLPPRVDAIRGLRWRPRGCSRE